MKTHGRVLTLTACVLAAMAFWFVTLRPQPVLAQSGRLTGSYGFSATSPYTGPNSTQLAIVGVLSFDGAGNVTGTETVVQPDPSPDATTVDANTLQLTGTYVLNSDGTGALKLTPSIPNAPTATTSFVLTDGGSGFAFVLSAGGNFLLSGSGRKQ